MILRKDEVETIEVFLEKFKMTRKDFAKEAGICIRTLQNALHYRNISTETQDKIYNVMFVESMQLILMREKEKAEKTNKVLNWAIAIVAGLLLFVLLGIFF